MDAHQTTGASSPIFWESLDLCPSLNHMDVCRPCAKPVLCLALKFAWLLIFVAYDPLCSELQGQQTHVWTVVILTWNACSGLQQTSKNDQK